MLILGLSFTNFFSIQLNPVITDGKGPTNLIHYSWIFTIAGEDIVGRQNRQNRQQTQSQILEI